MAGFPDTIEQSIRWIPAKNVGRFTVPAFGLVGLRPFSSTDTGDNGTFAFKWDSEHGRYLEITRPTSHHQILQHASHVAVAGPEDILPGRFGRVSKDWPLPVRTTAGGGTAIGELFGPLADEFRISDVGSAFRAMSFDPVPGIGFALLWIEPSQELRTSFHIGSSDSPITVSEDGELHRDPNPLVWTTVGSATLRVDLSSLNVTAIIPGVYAGTFEALIKAQSVDMATFIGMTMKKVELDDSETVTIFRGRRAHISELIQTGTVPTVHDDEWEQVLIPFAIDLQAGEGLHITADTDMIVTRRRWILQWHPSDIAGMPSTADTDFEAVEEPQEDDGFVFVPSVGIRGVGFDIVGTNNIVG